MVTQKMKEYYDLHPDHLVQLYATYKMDWEVARWMVSAFLLAFNTGAPMYLFMGSSKELSIDLVSNLTPLPHRKELDQFIGNWLSAQALWLEHEISELLQTWPALAGSADKEPFAADIDFDIDPEP